MKRFMAVIALMFAAGVMTGCNTVAGAGKDIERGGETAKLGEGCAAQNVTGCGNALRTQT